MISARAKLREKLNRKNKIDATFNLCLETDEENEKCKNFLDEGNYFEAIKCGKKALELVPLETPTKLIAPIWYNLGLAYEKVDINLSFKFYKKAERYFVGEEKYELHFRQALNYLQRGDLKRASEIAENMLESRGRLLKLQIKLLSNETSLEEIEIERSAIKLTNLEDIKKSFCIKMSIEALRGDVLSLRNSVLVLSKFCTLNEITYLTFRILDTFRMHGKFVEALELLNFVKDKVGLIDVVTDPNKEFNLFIINEFNNNYEAATVHLTKLSSFAQISPDATEMLQVAYRQRLYTEIDRKKYDLAREALKHTKLQHPWYSKIIDWLEKDTLDNVNTYNNQDSYQDSSEILTNAIIEADLDNEVQTNNTTNIEAFNNDSINSDQKLEETNRSEEFNIEDFDHKRIHKYFKDKKSLLAKKSIVTLDEGSISWLLPNGVKYDTSQKDIVHKIEDRQHYYICIKNNLKLGSTFINAMKKGIVSKSYSSTGIKFFKNSNSAKCVELKINGGDRAWSKTMYVNPEGDYLIVIDGYGNHVAADKAAKKGMEIFAVSSHLSSIDDVDKNVQIEDAIDRYDSNIMSNEDKKYSNCSVDDLKILGDIELN